MGTTIQVALITAAALVAVAVINGMFAKSLARELRETKKEVVEVKKIAEKLVNGKDKEE